MTKLVQIIADTQVAAGSVQAWWLGGNGFVFKTPAGTTLYVDPYFSNCVAQIFGIERAFPPPIRAEEARPDLLINTHWHEDHLDPEGVPILAKHSPTPILAPPSCVSRLLGWLIPRDRVTPFKTGETYEFRDVKITALPARHPTAVSGWEVDDAIGLLFDFGGLRIYYSGDTEYDERLRALAYDHERPIDVCMVVINGVGGNMNAYEAALLAWQLKAKTVIPMHHQLWKDFTGGEQATLDPHLLVDTYQRLGGRGQVKLLEVAEGITLEA